MVLAAATVALAVPAIAGVPSVADATAAPLPPIIIHVDDPSLDPTDPTLIAGARAQLARHADADRVPSFTVPENRAAASSDILVNYVVGGGSTEPPNDVKAVVDAAADAWNAAIDFQGPVVVDFAWQELQPGLLGFGGPTDLRIDGLPPANGAYYPVALANTLLATDTNGSRAEISITLDSDRFWYVDTVENAPPAGSRDLLSTVIHEIGHGLGFVGSPQEASFGQTVNMVYDNLVLFNGVPITLTANPDSHLRSGQLAIDIGGGRLHQVYDPATFITGSSFSHFAEIYGPGQPGALMSPVLSSNETERIIDGATLAVMRAIGWPLINGVAPADLTGTSSGDGTLQIDWSSNFATVSALPPSSFVVTLQRDGTTIDTATLGFGATSHTFTGLANYANYEYRVTARSGSIGAMPAVGSVSGQPRYLGVDGAGTQRTLGWPAIDGPGTSGAQFTIQRRSIGATTWTTIGTTGAESLVDSGIPEGSYQYRVIAQSSAGSSPYRYSTIEGVSPGPVRPMPLDGQISRLYAAGLDRTPDGAGIDYWRSQRASGVPIAAIATEFTASSEFVTNYGALDNAAFVDRIYRNVLDRAPDDEGRTYWLDQLASGLSRGAMLLGFSDSPEYINQTGTEAVQSSAAGKVFRLYFAYFLREPDEGGRSFWTNELANGTSLNTISAEFAASPEFVATYGSLSNERFVDLVYHNVLGRDPDPSGRASWLADLSNGLSRGDMMIGFSDSQEFILQTGTTP